jgi:hyperosmotically inducible periplasmic protein
MVLQIVPIYRTSQGNGKDWQERNKTDGNRNMKTTSLGIIGASVISVLAILAVAQDAPNSKTSAPHSTGDNVTAAPVDTLDPLLDPELRRLTEFVQNYSEADVDLTARNDGDHDGGTRPPPAQGKTQADVDVTAKIHEGIMAGNSMSENARNVQIGTLNGRVTLRGSVDTSEDKLLIGVIAARIAHPENVDNQLEVTFATASN